MLRITEYLPRIEFTIYQLQAVKEGFEIPKTSFLESNEFHFQQHRTISEDMQIVIGARIWELDTEETS